MNAAHRNGGLRLVTTSVQLADRPPLPRSWIEAAAMTVIGLPVAIAIAMFAHGMLHYGLRTWLGAVICFLAAAASKTAVNLYRRQYARP